MDDIALSAEPINIILLRLRISLPLLRRRRCMSGKKHKSAFFGAKPRYQERNNSGIFSKERGLIFSFLWHKKNQELRIKRLTSVVLNS